MATLIGNITYLLASTIARYIREATPTVPLAERADGSLYPLQCDGDGLKLGAVAGLTKCDTDHVAGTVSVTGVTACDTGHVTVDSCVLPAHAATDTLQTAGNASSKAIECPNMRLAATTTLASNPHDWTGAPATGGILVDIDGEYKLTLSGDTEANFITPKLLAGVHYPYSVSRIWATGSPTGAKVTPFLARV